MNSHFIIKAKKLVVLTLIAGFLVMPIAPILAEETVAPISSATVETTPVDVDPTSVEVTPVVVEVPPVADIDSAPIVLKTIEVPETIATSSEVLPITPTTEIEVASGTPSITADPISTSTEQLPTLVVDENIDLPDQIAKAADILGEDSFVTASDIPADGKNLASGDELTFITLQGNSNIPDNMAISEENPFEDNNSSTDPATSSEGQVETLPTTGTELPVTSAEGNFTTTTVPDDNDEETVSVENSFTTNTVPTDDTQAISAEQSFNTLGLPDTDPAISAEQSFTTLSIPTDSVTVSDENSFTTLTIPTDGVTVSDENSFTTLPGQDDTDPAISDENSFTTLSIPTDNVTISDENSFTTLSFPTDNVTVSDENSFTTLSIPTDNVTVSDENSFTTLSLPTDNVTVSDENSFTTLSLPTDNVTVSDENSFTTLSIPTDGVTVSGENSFTTNSGSHGCTGPNCGGGGGGSSGGQVLGQQTYRCEVLLYKFIRYGQANDRREVVKLQAFLRVFEGFNNLKITGVYDLPTYRAVEIFQKRYRQDILGPWNISDSTGYVYITTRIAINNIFCGRDTTNNMDLYDRFYREYQAAMGEAFNPTPDTGTSTGYFIAPTTTEATSSPVVKTSWLLAGLGNLFDFIGDNLCWLLNLFLLLIIFFLLWLLWLSGRNDDDDLTGDKEPLKGHIANGDLGLIGAIALDEIMSEDDKLVLAALAEEEDSQIPAANNDPDQHIINL